VKKTGGFVAFLVVFAAGFVAGILFSSWKLDSAGVPGPGQRKEAREEDRASELRNRIAAVEQMLQANPDNLPALIQLGNDYFDAGDFQKAVEAYSKALRIDPGNADVMTDMAIGHRRLGNPQEAVKWFRKAVETQPDHAIALFNLGIVLRDDLKDNAGALKAWEGFLEKAGDSPHAVMVRPWVKKLREAAGTPSTETGKDAAPETTGSSKK